METNQGDIDCDFVVSAAGPQTGLLAEMAGAFVPVSPARVEIIITAPIPGTGPADSWATGCTAGRRCVATWRMAAARTSG